MLASLSATCILFSPFILNYFAKIIVCKRCCLIVCFDHLKRCTPGTQVTGEETTPLVKKSQRQMTGHLELADIEEPLPPTSEPLPPEPISEPTLTTPPQYLQRTRHPPDHFFFLWPGPTTSFQIYFASFVLMRLGNNEIKVSRPSEVSGQTTPRSLTESFLSKTLPFKNSQK